MPKFTGTTTVPFATDEIDLETWLYNMSDQEYQRTARQHRALGVFFEDGVRGMINVEVMGHALLIQHYHDVIAGKSYVELYSERSRAYLFHNRPRDRAGALDDDRDPARGDESSFSCSVETTMPSVVQFLARATGVLWAVRRHVAEETLGYAVDLTRKVQAKATRLVPGAPNATYA